MKAVAGIVLLLLAVLAGWFLMRTADSPPVAQAPGVVAPPAPISAPAPAETAAAEIKYPIEQVVASEEPTPAAQEPAAEPEPEVPPPTLADSGPRVNEWVLAVLGGPLRELLVSDNLIRRIVATVDNLPREKAAVRLWPVATVKGLPVVRKEGEAISLLAANEARYASHIALVESANLNALVGGYKKLYPLFQEAYRELGYPSGNFNDRLVAVIDHLLLAPEIDPPIALVQPKVVYRYADPELESLTAGEKIMVRIGPGNARRVKERLRAIRQRLAGQL